MAYSPAAIERRRCLGTRKDGQPCRAWALWDDPRQLCAQHAGRGARGPRGPNASRWPYAPEKRTNYTPCTCRAYDWPHRPGSGLCRWPDPPMYRRTTPAGTRSELARLMRSRKLTQFKALRRRHGW